MRLVAIGENTQSVKKWNPKAEAPDDEFAYIDIASVSQELKQVNGVSRLLGCDAPSRARQLVRAGDVVVSTVRPNLNAIAYIPEELDGATASTGFSVLRPDPNQLDPRYLYHWVRTQEFVSNMVKQATGQSYPAVSDKIVQHSDIPLPPVEEQKRIAAILDQADALRRLRQRAFQKLVDLKHSMFNATFGNPNENKNLWPCKPAGDVADCIVPGRDKPKSFTGDVPWITTAELTPLGVTSSVRAKAFLSNQEISQVRARIIPEGSVLMTCVGDLGVVSIAGADMVINQQLHSFQCGSSVRPTYLMFALSYQKSWMLKMATQTTLPYMNKSICNGVPIIIPPVELQIKFEDAVHKIEQVETSQTTRLSGDEALFASLQSNAFRGEL